MHVKPSLAMKFGLPVAEHPSPHCKVCGTPPPTFELNGEVRPNRVTEVGGPEAEKRGTAGMYCERCVCQANQHAAKKRQEQKRWQQTMMSRLSGKSKTNSVN